MEALTLMMLLLQAPGDGWALAQVGPQQVKTIYWELFDASETWVSIIPAGPEGEQPLVRMIFQAFFAGKEPKGAPNRVVIRALSLPLTVVKEYSLRLIVDEEAFDLGSSCMPQGGAGPPCLLLYPVCSEGCAANGLAVDVHPALLEKIAEAHSVTGTVLGYPVMLSSADLAAVGKFATTIHPGTASRK